jgi:zinc protease
LQSRQVSRSQDNEQLGRSNTYLFIGRTFQWDADFEAKIRALTPEQINTAMRRYTDPSKITIIKSGDFTRNPPK